MQVHSEVRPKTEVAKLEPLKEHRVLFLTQSRLDELIGGFSASEMVLLDSSSRYVFDLSSMLCVLGVSAFNEEVIFVDGGNSIDPYGIANICKKRGYDKKHVLSQINCARAFTAYQLVTIINDRLKNMISESKASTLIVSHFVDLFFDKDMPWTESFQLIKRSLATIKKLTARHNLITVITNYGLAKLHYRRGLRNLMYNTPDKLVRIEERKKFLLVSMPRKDEFIQYYPVPTYQTLLEDFFLRNNNGKNSAYI
jgi:hypothetical protein